MVGVLPGPGRADVGWRVSPDRVVVPRGGLVGGVGRGTIAVVVDGLGAGGDGRVAGVVRVEVSAGGRCWMDGRPAVAGERLPGRGRRVRLLCRHCDAAVFGGPAALAELRAQRGDQHS
ncbi:hypothetical protein [Saccharothrix obliqua]|uniref:hypothetical protein n=1 Tax=Saccharothrix obliqua TaxID=2861747 RepID=UPI001C5EB483|nr:hypothetical protein [Saccharothrix obliqua]MBW4722406.1 hypothetical protein [Saccharothrix obliqua]